jgi:hypothetical protein
LDFAKRLVPKGSVFSAILVDLLGRPDCDVRFQELLATDFSIGELAQALACVESAHQPHLVSLLSKELIDSLCEAGFDFTIAFSELKPSIQSHILTHIVRSSFDSLTDAHRALLAAKEDRFKVFVVRRCVEAGAFIQAMKFARVAALILPAISPSRRSSRNGR